MPGTMFVVGSLNMDFVVGVQHVPVPGETVLSPLGYIMLPGGKGAKEACTVGRLMRCCQHGRMCGG